VGSRLKIKCLPVIASRSDGCKQPNKHLHRQQSSFDSFRLAEAAGGPDLPSLSGRHAEPVLLSDEGLSAGEQYLADVEFAPPPTTTPRPSLLTRLMGAVTRFVFRFVEAVQNFCRGGPAGGSPSSSNQATFTQNR
jgi:hypothetical protein